MTEEGDGTRYTHGHHASVLRSHRWRTAENSASYLLPHLVPGSSLLDVGCGPGTITVDLARRVAPGRVIGLDRSDEAIDSRVGSRHRRRRCDLHHRRPLRAALRRRDLRRRPRPPGAPAPRPAGGGIGRDGPGVPTGRHRRRPRRRLRDDDLVPGVTRARPVGSTSTGGRPAPTAASRTPAAACPAGPGPPASPRSWPPRRRGASPRRRTAGGGPRPGPNASAAPCSHSGSSNSVSPPARSSMRSRRAGCGGPTSPTAGSRSSTARSSARWAEGPPLRTVAERSEGPGARTKWLVANYAVRNPPVTAGSERGEW